MPSLDYIFVDESGDPGFTLDPSSGQLLSSKSYVAAALHLCDDAFRAVNQHVAAFRYLSGLSRELKIPPEKQDFTRLLDPIRVMSEGGQHIWASVVYLDKLRYTGSYLQPGGKRPVSPIRFRNYILRRLLEHHFNWRPTLSSKYELVIDRIDLSLEDVENLRQYLAGNRHIPTPIHITHASSIYVEGLQLVHHIANGYGGVVEGKAAPDAISFVKGKDITTIQSISG